MTIETTPITETNHFIILDKYTKIEQPNLGYQTEADLEQEFIADLQTFNYEYRADITTPERLLGNAREQLQQLNNVVFLDSEWQRFLTEYLDKPAENIIDKTRKIHNDYIYDFVFDNGRIQNIYLIDKTNIARNRLQVINQFEQAGSHSNRYDVTILVNGLPLVQVELKKRGVAIREAFNQVHRYSKESFNKENSLFKYL
ncbi:type I restriction endonuclease subunit R, partial [Glaesserella parasuis]|nr:type I restriction endonuclease subunit R [Glaesserella parasuis]